MSNRILIVGGAGYIGGHLADQLARAGLSVTVLDNLTYEHRYFKPVHFIHADVRDRRRLAQILPHYDVVVWLAALVGDGACDCDPEHTMAINTQAVEWLVQNYRGRIIFASTCSVYGRQDGVLDETSTPGPISLYAKSKYAAEQIVTGRVADHFVARFGTLFGSGGAYSRLRLDLVVNLLSARAAAGEPVSIIGPQQWRPFMHVADAAGVLFWAITQNLQGVHNVAWANKRLGQIAEVIRRYVPHALIDESDISPDDLRNYQVSTAKIQATGWQPAFSLDDGVREIAHLVQSGRVRNHRDPNYSNAQFLRSDDGLPLPLHR